MWLPFFSTEQQELLLLTSSLSLLCTCSAAEQFLPSFALTPGLSHRCGLIHAAVWTDVLLPSILTALSFRLALPLPLAVVYPRCWGNRSILVFARGKNT